MDGHHDRRLSQAEGTLTRFQLSHVHLLATTIHPKVPCAAQMSDARCHADAELVGTLLISTSAQRDFDDMLKMSIAEL